MSLRQGFFEVAHELQDQRIPFVVSTLLKVEGHAPQNPGAKIIVTQKGLHWGTVGGGKVEARAIATALEYLQAGTNGPQALYWNLQKDIGMSCGGAVEFLFETFGVRTWKIAVFGAGHVAQALVRLLGSLDCDVTCVDHRSEWIEKMPVQSRIDLKLVANPPDAVAELDPDTYFVVMTQGHATDVPVLSRILQANPKPRYIGVLGSDVKALKIKKELADMGYDSNQVRSPMGLPIGSNSPAEIAISIAGELLQVRGS